MWNLSGPGIKRLSPALAGEFLTTGLPGKSCSFVLIVHMCQGLILGSQYCSIELCLFFCQYDHTMFSSLQYDVVVFVSASSLFITE